MTTKRAEERAVKIGKGSSSKGAGAEPASLSESKTTPAVSPTTQVRPASAPAQRKRPSPPKPAPARGPVAREPVAREPVAREPVAREPVAPVPPAGEVAPLPGTADAGIQALRGELRDLKQMVQTLATQTSALADTLRPPAAASEPLEGAMNSLRRLLSELLEDHVESIVKDVAEARREAASLAAGRGARVVERLDHTLEKLGAVKFEGETMDIVDPLIHVVVEERHEKTVPDGVILAALRPGFRTGRGLVVCKAGVAVNRRS